MVKTELVLIDRLVLNLLREQACRNDIDRDATLAELGLDSLDLMQSLIDLEEIVRDQLCDMSSDRQALFNAFAELKAISDGNVRSLTPKQIIAHITSKFHH